MNKETKQSQYFSKTQPLAKSLQQLQKIKRKHYHPLIHHIHHVHGLSKKTLLYVKEYGQHSNVARTIIKESLLVLLFTSVLSSVGGFALEDIKTLFVSIVPLIILLPVLNDMIGDYGTIISSRFTTLLHEGKVRGHWSKNLELRKIFYQILIISLTMTFIGLLFAFSISYFKDYSLNLIIALKIMFICVLDMLILVNLLFFMSVYAGFYFFRKNEDPDNLLIPLTTSIADFGNMLLLTGLVLLFF